MARWKGKTVVVTGGSAGLGLAIAREFGRRGATPVLLSRSQEQLTAALEDLAQDSIIGDSVVADATNEQQVAAAVTDIVARHGGIDVWVNNVGKSTRVELDKATLDDYREFMELNLLTAVTGTRFALPELIKSAGHLVNIGSLSSRTAWPFLAPYTASKFALAGYTQQLRMEGPSNVHYMLVCPGPIKRDDAGYRYERRDQQLPEKAHRPGAGAGIEGLSPAKVAKAVVRGCEKRKLEVVLPPRIRLLFVFSSIWPALGDWILRRRMS